MGARETIARKVAQLLVPGDFVNLGAGIPVLVKDYIRPDWGITILTENGILGATVREADAPFDRYCTDASEMPVGILPGGSTLDSVAAFGLICGGHLSVTVLGAMQVDREGNLANWAVPGGKTVGMGGAMDLVTGAKRVIVATEHTTKAGEPKIVEKCSYPLTGHKVVSAIVTELAYFDIVGEGLVLRETAPGVTLDEITARTGAAYSVAEDVRTMAL
jgi:3-oxoacid CoA-transferase B subunit